MMHLEFPTIFPVTSHTDHVGVGSTFVVVQGTKKDGVDYIAQAITKGATKIVIQEDVVLSPELLVLMQQRNVSLQRVANTRLALAQLSAQALNYPAKKLNIIGITGTKGKTTTTFVLEHLLKTAGFATARLSTVGNRILDTEYSTSLTTQQPDYLQMFLHLCVQAGVTHVIMEVSAQALSLHRVEGIEFDGVIFTNFSQEHGEFYPTLQDYFSAKLLIFDQLKKTGAAFINVDDEHGRNILRDHKNFSSFGLNNNAHVSAEVVQATQQGIQFAVRYNNQTLLVSCPTLIGVYNIYNVLGAAALAHSYGVSFETVAQALLTFTRVPGRMERYQLPNGAVCVIDYAHTPSSFHAILHTLRHMTDHLIVVFGCGGDRDPIKRPQMGRIAAECGDLVFITSDNPRSEELATIIEQIKSGVAHEHAEKVVCEYDRAQAITRACAASKAGTIIALLGKGPDEYQEVRGVKTFFSERQIIQSFSQNF